jgi:hypothetical protein
MAFGWSLVVLQDADKAARKGRKSGQGFMAKRIHDIGIGYRVGGCWRYRGPWLPTPEKA